MNDVTRYLCAGAHVDGSFRNHVLSTLLHSEVRAMGPCHGVNLIAVLRHALWANRRARTQELVLLGALVISVLTRNVPIMVILGIVAAICVAYMHWYRDYRILRTQLGRTIPESSEPPVELDPDQENRLQLASGDTVGNVVVYGEFSPFVGSGVDLDGWSFVVELDKPKRALGALQDDSLVLPFESTALYEQIQKSISELGVPHLKCFEQIFVHGEDVAQNNMLLPDRYRPPRASMGDAFVSDYRGRSTHTIRHYCCIRLIDWGGEIVLSAFVRAGQVSKNLFVEASFFLLPPVKESFHQVDRIPASPSVRQWFLLALIGLFGGPILAVLSPLLLFARVQSWQLRRNERKATRRSIRDNPAFNYGALKTVREAATSGNYRRYFQKLDKELHVKMLQRRVLDAIVDYLDSRGIDTSEVRERGTTILNHGVIVTGGSMQAQSMAVGAMAKVSQLFHRAGGSAGTGTGTEKRTATV